MVKDNLIGELAEKYNFTADDFSEIKEDVQEKSMMNMVKEQIRTLF